jgi:hypothetical protein
MDILPDIFFIFETQTLIEMALSLSLQKMDTRYGTKNTSRKKRKTL